MSEEKNNQEEEKKDEEAQEESSKEDAKKEEKGNAIAVLSYLGILVIIPILTNKDDDFVKFHIKQGLVLLIVWVFNMFVGVVPILGWIIAPLIALVLLVFVVIGIINVLSGKKKQLPLIGQYAEKLKI